ncbi:MAG: DNA-methyltransferase [Candidatus Heimdallarchaeota archaeon]
MITVEEKFVIENQTIFFQSAEKMEDVPDESVTLVVTSPPYWSVRDYGSDQIGFGQAYEDYISSLNRVWAECMRVLQPNGKIAINIQPLPINRDRSGFGRRVIKNIMFDIQKYLQAQGAFLSGMHYWDKAEYVSNVSWGSYPKPTNIASNTGFEQVFVWVKQGKTRKVDKAAMRKSLLTKEEWRHWAVRCIWDDISPVFKINHRGENKFGHSAPFPEDIPYRLIRMHSVRGETVLDPFLGSGTTLKVCRLIGRRGIGYEINSDYKKLIQSRILEPWKPPRIQSQYKTFGTADFYQILEIVYEFLGKDISSKPRLTEVIQVLRKEFPEKITKSWETHLLEELMRNQRKKWTKPTKSLTSYF